jgi:hypothetical protein
LREVGVEPRVISRRTFDPSRLRRVELANDRPFLSVPARLPDLGVENGCLAMRPKS